MPGIREHALDDDGRAGERLRRLQTDVRRHRHERVPEDVVHEDVAQAQPFGARCGHVLLVQLVDHRRPHHLRDAPRDRQRKREPRHDQLLERAGSRRRQPVELHGEEQDQHGAEPELRQRQPEQRRGHRRRVRGGAGPRRREHAERDRDQQRNREPEADELERVSEPRRDGVAADESSEIDVAEVEVRRVSGGTSRTGRAADGQARAAGGR